MSKTGPQGHKPFEYELCMVVGFTTICAISAYHHWSCEFEPRSWWGVLDTTLCDTVCQWLATGWWFSSGTPVSSTNKTSYVQYTTQNLYTKVLWPYGHMIWNSKHLLVHTFILFGNKLKIIIRSFKMKYICCISQLLLNITLY